MGMIYRSAKRVRIWLGEADDHTPLVFSLLSSVFCMVPGIGPESVAECHNLLAEQIESTAEALSNFLSRP